MRMCSMANTAPNPLLVSDDGRPPLPAYELRSWDKEREGRRIQRDNVT